jgi:hypothetical protein
MEHCSSSPDLCAHVPGILPQAGTFGPQTGDGYLYTEWKGPKADLFKRVLQRHAEHRDVPQAQVQLILWAIIARTDMSRLQPETKVAAAKLLTPVEMADLLGYKLGVVPDGVRQRALQSAPAPVRELLEAENEMRRLLTSADTRYADMERVARTGTGRRRRAIHCPKRTLVLPPRRILHPLPPIDILQRPRRHLLPGEVRARRDASGRIISIPRQTAVGSNPTHLNRRRCKPYRT